LRATWSNSSLRRCQNRSRSSRMVCLGSKCLPVRTPLRGRHRAARSPYPRAGLTRAHHHESAARAEHPHAHRARRRLSGHRICGPLRTRDRHPTLSPSSESFPLTERHPYEEGFRVLAQSG
jgi:hypothetical protein